MLKLSAYAKLDLAIDISPKKLADGYFPVHYIDTQIDLCDELTFESQKSEIEVVCDNLELNDPKENFVYKTAVKFRNIIGREELGVKITLLKNIPIRAGFGGGSSDGAATLLGLSELWKVRLSDNQIAQLAKTLGKDFYYSIYGGLCEVIGKGKNYKISSISSVLPNFWFTIVVPKEEKPSTAWVYEHLDVKKVGENSGKFGKLKEAILKKDGSGILKNLTNDFENYVSRHFPIVLAIKNDLERVGALSSIMAGSGLSVVGFFGNKKDAEVGKAKLSGKYKNVLVVKIIN